MDTREAHAWIIFSKDHASCCAESRLKGPSVEGCHPAMRGTVEKVQQGQTQDMSCRYSQHDLLMANLMVSVQCDRESVVTWVFALSQTVVPLPQLTQIRFVKEQKSPALVMLSLWKDPACCAVLWQQVTAGSHFSSTYW